jgi:hypothetical protein
VHDSALLVVPDQGLDETLVKIADIMNASSVWAPTLPVASDITVGKSYGGCE